MFSAIASHRIKRSRIVCAACLSAAAGILLAQTWVIGDVRWVWLLAPVLVASWRRHNLLTLVVLGVICFMLGWWRGSECMRRLAINETFYEQKVVLVGRSTEDAVYGKQYQLEFSMADARVLSPQQAGLVGSVTVRGFGEPMVYRGAGKR